MLKYFCFIVLVFTVACNYHDKKNELRKKKLSEMTTKERVEDVKKDIIPTDKNPKNEEWQGNVYRNKKYQFRIEFPKGWEYDRGTAKSTLARALNRNYAAVIAVGVTHLPEQPKNSNDIFESLSIEEYSKHFNEVLALQNTKAENLKIQKGALNNFPAYVIEFTSLASSGTQSYVYLSKQIQSYYDGKIYQITLNLPNALYDTNMDKYYNRVVNSFNFEIAY